MNTVGMLGTLGAFILIPLGLSSQASGAPIQWPVSEGGNGHWYEAISAPNGISWLTAQQEAESAGGYLATLTSQAENDWVLGNFISQDSWIGAVQNVDSPDYSEPLGGWEWTTGEPFDFTFWRAEQPNNQGGTQVYLCFDAVDAEFDAGWNDRENLMSCIHVRIRTSACIHSRSSSSMEKVFGSGEAISTLANLLRFRGRCSISRVS